MGMNGRQGVLAAMGLGLAALTPLVGRTKAEEVATRRGVTASPYLVIDGKEVDPSSVRITRTGARIAASYRAPRDGTYRFGVVITADRIAALSRLERRYSAGRALDPEVLRYPYDWTWGEPQGNVLWQPRLMLPGVRAGGKTYVVDTHELTARR
jgi:hypothetical protein